MKSVKFSGSVSEGEPIDAPDGILYSACCDCGLTHMMVITVMNKTGVEVRFFRDNHRTFHRRKSEKYKFRKKK